MLPRVPGQEPLASRLGQGLSPGRVSQQLLDGGGDLLLRPVAGDLPSLRIALQQLRLHVGEEGLAAGGGLEDTEGETARDRLGIGPLQMEAAPGVELRKVGQGEAAGIDEAEGMAAFPHQGGQFPGPGLGLFQVAGEDGDGGGPEGGAEHPAPDLVLPQVPRQGAEGEEGVGRPRGERFHLVPEARGEGGEDRFDEGKGIRAQRPPDDGGLDLAGRFGENGGEGRLPRLDRSAGGEGADEDDFLAFPIRRRRQGTEPGRIGGEVDGKGGDAVALRQPRPPVAVPDAVLDEGPPQGVEEAGFPFPAGEGPVGIVEPEADEGPGGDLGPLEEPGQSEDEGIGGEEGGGLSAGDGGGDDGGGLLRRGVGTAEGVFLHLVPGLSQCVGPFVEGQVAEPGEGVEEEIKTHGTGPALANGGKRGIGGFFMPDEPKKQGGQGSQSRKGSAAFLVVDVSNSFTKYAPATAGRLGSVATHPTPALHLAAVRGLARRFPAEAVLLSSVVPERTALFRRVFGKRLFVLHGEAPLGMPVRYPNKARIGADRLANALAVRRLFGTPAVVIDFGTAVTFDVIDPKGAYCGGVIAPGLNVMTEYLHERTALLPRVTVREPRRAIGKSTEEAIRVGAVIGYRGMIREILAAVRQELLPKGGRLHVVATGGQAGVVAKRMPEIEAVLPGLTLDGLRFWGETVLPKK